MDAMSAGMRRVNDNVLSPLELAARSGNPAALAARATVEGAPQAIGRTAEGMTMNRRPFVPAQPTLQELLARPAVAPAVDTSGYATGTAVR